MFVTTHYFKKYYEGSYTEFCFIVFFPTLFMKMRQLERRPNFISDFHGIFRKACMLGSKITKIKM